MEQTRRPYYRLIDHTADMGMEIFGSDPAELFANAARAVFAELAPSVAPPASGGHHRPLAIEGQDWADLMVNWLRELLFLWNGEQQILCGLQIQRIRENRLEAVLAIREYVADGDTLGKEIKAVTYHQIHVGPDDAGGWRARVIFDV